MPAPALLLAVTDPAALELHRPLLQAALALAGWTFVMWGWMYATRLPAILRSGMRLDPHLPRGI
jgi:hypothetical protein